MNVMEAIKSRRSIRSYQDRPVEEEKLQAVLEAAQWAASARNMQEWKFIVVRDQERRQELMKAAKNQKFVGEAPVVIAACGTITDHVMSCGQLSYPIDVAIAVTDMTLEAVELGLGTCWIGAFREDEVKRILSIPDDVRVLALTPLGYPDEEPRDRGRKELSEIISYDKY